MPHGNAQMLPSGIWTNTPTTGDYRYLVLRSCKTVALAVTLTCMFNYVRSIQWKYSAKRFVGRTMMFGNFTQLSHDPLPPEEIDRMLEQQRMIKLHKM